MQTRDSSWKPDGRTKPVYKAIEVGAGSSSSISAPEDPWLWRASVRGTRDEPVRGVESLFLVVVRQTTKDLVIQERQTQTTELIDDAPRGCLTRRLIRTC